MENKLGGFLIFGVLLVGLFLIMKKNPATAQYNQQDYYIPNEEPPIKLQAHAAGNVNVSDGGRRYRNNETWDIVWNADGLPSKVTIHRDASQT